MSKKIIKLSLLTGLLLLIDIGTKYFFYDLKILNGIFNPQFNIGIARSVSIPMIIIILISILALILFVFSYIRGYIGYIISSLLIAGTLGNLIDRILLGGVRDFIDIGVFHFPIFNVADVLLNIGIIVFIIFEFWPGKKDEIK